MKKIVSFLLTFALMLTTLNLNAYTAYAADDTYFAYRVDVVDSKATSTSRIAIDVASNKNGKTYSYALGSGSDAPTIAEIKKKGTQTEILANNETTTTAYCYSSYSNVKIGNSYDVYICFEAENGKVYGPYVEEDWIAKYYVAGDGTKTNPYQIWNYRHLYNTAQLSNTTYVKLMQNIDLTDCPYSGYALGDGTFEGEFDGNHKSIINMYGKLICKLAENSVVKDTYLVGVNSETEGKKSVAKCDCAFVDKNYGTVMNCAVINSNYNTHNDTYDSGVICVSNYSSGVITDCKVVNSTVICAWGYVGGIVGRNEGRVSNCYFNGTITNASTGGTFGGIVGLNIRDTAIVDSCYSAAVFESAAIRGGIVGQLSSGMISNCVSNYIPDDVWSVVRLSASNQGSIVGNAISGVTSSNVNNNQGAIISKPVSDGTPEVNKDLENLEKVWDIYNGALSSSGVNTMVDPLSDAVIATDIANLTGMKGISFLLDLYPSYETLEYNSNFPAKCNLGDTDDHVHSGTKVPKVEPTCMEYGVKEYYECSCGKFFLEEACENEITNLSLWKSEAGRIEKRDHELENNVVEPATTTQNGVLEIRCSVCENAICNETIYAASTLLVVTPKYTYDGKVKKPGVMIKDTRGNSISNKNYDVSYAKGRKNVGKYKITITFKQMYRGTKDLSFVINPSKTTIKSLAAKSKSFEAKWTKKTTQVTGYELQYSLSSTFKSGNKTVKIKSASTVSKTVKSLKAKKKYYLRIRTYKTVSGKNYYSEWSAKKTVTTKK